MNHARTTRRGAVSRRVAIALILIACVGAAGASMSCRATVPNRDPRGEVFPTTMGSNLDGEPVQLPGDLAGAPAILLVGYVQKAQFDADRWLFGLLQAATPVKMLEVPTIPGLMPTLLSGTIDKGMRSGIPHEDWGVVVTLYGSRAEDLVTMTGNENPRNIRVLLLDAEGTVRWFHDRGFSAGKLQELDTRARELLPR